MKQSFITLLIALLYLPTGCSFLGTSANSKNQLISKEITFIDTETFDNTLSSSMSAGAKMITIFTLGDASLNHLPERLGKWLSAVENRGGKLNMDPKPSARSVGLLTMFLEPLTNLVMNEYVYGSAGRYDVKVVYEPTSGKLKQVLFSLREGGE